MGFLWPILAKIGLICQQPRVSGAHPTSGVPERITGGWWDGLAMVWWQCWGCSGPSVTADTVCCMKLLFVGQHCGLQRSYHFYVQGQSIDKTGHSMYTDTRDWGEERIVCLANWWQWNLDMLYWTGVSWLWLNRNRNVMQCGMMYWTALSCGSIIPLYGIPCNVCGSVTPDLIKRLPGLTTLPTLVAYYNGWGNIPFPWIDNISRLISNTDSMNSLTHLSVVQHLCRLYPWYKCNQYKHCSETNHCISFHGMSLPIHLCHIYLGPISI